MLKAVARRAVWERDARNEVLVRFLASTATADSYRLDDVLELLKLAETYHFTDAADLLGRIPHWRRVLRQEISSTGDLKPFFNDRVQELHGGGRDQRRTEDARVLAKEREAEFLARLPALLAP